MTRRELIEAVGERYRKATGENRRTILDEFVEVTGYHRKHAIRLFGASKAGKLKRGTAKRIYDDAVQQALIVLWEAADRICGKRLKPLLSILVEAMERHGHLKLDAEIKQALLLVSAATIDRLLSKVRQSAKGVRRKSGIATALRRSIPIRTFADWNNPAPGYMEADLVAHSGGSMAGSMVHSFVLTDVATGWTECIALLARDQTMIVDALTRLRDRLPFPLFGLDTDNDAVFINEAVLGYCRQNTIEFTRSRAYRKNDQAWIEQKNGSVVRKLVGYGRLEGMTATDALANLYEASRLYVNFFQPSFKLKSKTREGARVTKSYHAPATPYQRLIDSTSIPESTKEQLRAQFLSLDPILLLASIRHAQSRLVALERNASGTNAHSEQTTLTPSKADIARQQRAFVAGLRTAWREGEVRPTHQKRIRPPRNWRTRRDPFEASWPLLRAQLEDSPGTTAKELFQRLQDEQPDIFSNGQLRTLQRRVKDWRREIVKRLLFGAEQDPRTSGVAAPTL